MSYNSKTLCWLRYTCGIALCIGGIWATWYSARVVYAQMEYQRIRYRDQDMPLEDVHQEALTQYAIYPHNYHLSQWIAEKAFYDYGNTDIAAHWTNIGLEQNPYRRNLRWLEVVLVGMENPEESARLWESYSDTVFWNRWVMAGRVYWLALAGRVEEAEHYMEMLRRSHGNHAWAEEALEIARTTQ